MLLAGIAWLSYTSSLILQPAIPGLFPQWKQETQRSRSIQASWSLGLELAHHGFSPTLLAKASHSPSRFKGWENRVSLDIRRCKVMWQRTWIRGAVNWCHFCNQCITAAGLKLASVLCLLLCFCLHLNLAGAFFFYFFFSLLVHLRRFLKIYFIYHFYHLSRF